MEDGDRESVSVVTEGSQNMYMSHENIYVTFTEYVNEYQLRQDILKDVMESHLTDKDKKLIEDIKDIDNQILSQSEKENKIFQIYQRAMSRLSRDDVADIEEEIEDKLQQKLKEIKSFENTVINKISYDKDKIEPVANGRVPGQISNQFSMDEYDDVFRIATTTNGRWFGFAPSTESENNIYTLDEDLEIMDELTGLAEGERIFSTRFVEDRLYMVTFRQSRSILCN